MLDAAAGKDFAARRDHAIIRRFFSTGMRRAELAGLQLGDVDLTRQHVTVMGKGARKRVCHYGDKTALALSRYLRTRAQEPRANSAARWIGKSGAVGVSGLAKIVERRFAEAGVKEAGAHSFRHLFADGWLSAGGAEGDLMRLAAWSNRTMVDRYARSSASERALEAHKRMGLDDQI